MGMTNDGPSYWQAESEGIDLLETTIGDLLDRRAEELPTQEAVVYSRYPEFGDALNIRWTYQQYRDRANQVARGLMALGLHKGDHIAVWAVNLPEWLLLEMAAAKAGLVLVTVNPVLRVAEVEYILKQGDVIEAFLIRHPKVADAQVLGVPDAFFGEELLAVLIPKAGEQLTEQELRDYCKGRISHQKIPRYFQFVESYPLTASGKVQKFVLRERAIKALGLEEVANVRTA